MVRDVKRRIPSVLESLLCLVCSFTVGPLAGCSTDHLITPGRLPDSGQALGTDAGQVFPDTGIGGGSLRLDRLAPDHGSFAGGTETVLRGSGFTEDAEVRVGGRLVQPADTTLIDERRLRVIVPPGEVGPADVELTSDAGRVLLPDGFIYDPFFVYPDRGAVSGGTQIEIVGSGTTFDDQTSIDLGGQPCGDVVAVSPTRMTCRTPASVAGAVDVTVNQAGAPVAIAEDAFTYYDSSDPVNGGLGGGPLDGALNVTVVNAGSGAPEPDAFVIVGDDLSTPYQGTTDLRGQITFSGADLVGPTTVHVAKECFEKTSFVAFDATDVTVFLNFACPPPPNPGGGLGRGRFGSTVAGELIWEGPNEFGPNPWLNVPAPGPNEIRVTYVMTTDASPDQGLIWPGIGVNGEHRVLEVLPNDGRPHLGYPYRVFARPSGFAVFALAGIEDVQTRVFSPYVMGIARNVLAGPGEDVVGADMVMNIPLDTTLDVDLNDIPRSVRSGPDRFRVEAYLDLGGEGVIRRSIVRDELLCLSDEQCPAKHTCEPVNVGGGSQLVCVQRFDVVRGLNAQVPFRLFDQPSRSGALRDGRFWIRGGWYTGPFESTPYSVRVDQGIASTGVAAVNDFLGIPEPVEPPLGARLGADRVLRWEADRDPPAFHVVVLTGSDNQAAWRLFVPGDVNEAIASGSRNHRWH